MSMPAELLEHEAAEARHKALDCVRNAAALVLLFHDGPRDAHYFQTVDATWTILREALADVASMDERQGP